MPSPTAVDEVDPPMACLLAAPGRELAERHFCLHPFSRLECQTPWSEGVRGRRRQRRATSRPWRRASPSQWRVAAEDLGTRFAKGRGPVHLIPGQDRLIAQNSLIRVGRGTEIWVGQHRGGKAGPPVNSIAANPCAITGPLDHRPGMTACGTPILPVQSRLGRIWRGSAS